MTAPADLEVVVTKRHDETVTELEVRAPKLTVSDALREAHLDLTSTLGRSVLTAVGTVIGIAVLVSTLGLASSAGARIATRFDALAATEVLVGPPPSAAGGSADGGGDEAPESPIPDDAPARLAVIDGVVSSATLSPIKSVSTVQGTPILDPGAGPSGVSVVASSPTLPDTVHAALEGRFFDAFHDGRGEPVAVLGATAARELNISDLSTGPAVFVDGRPLVVVGIITSTKRRPELLNEVIVPDGFARRELGLVHPAQVVVETRVGAADVVGRQVPYALRPDVPDTIQVLVPPTPTFTRDQVASDTSALFVLLAGISLVIGGLGIANVTLVSVLERVPEIGLRRALGAKRVHVAAQFLLEAAVLGFLGAVAGAALGVIAVVAASSWRGWPATINLWLPITAPLFGALIGLLAGLYPAYRASRVEPVEALRGAT